MSSELVAAAARAETEDVLQRKYDAGMRVTDWHSDVIEAIWQEPKFEWEQFSRRPFGYQELKLAFWCGGELFLMAVATIAGTNVLIRHVEANPDQPMFKGQRIIMVLEAAANYASGIDLQRKWQIVMKPERQELLNFLVGKCGFVEQPDGQCHLELETYA